MGQTLLLLSGGSGCWSCAEQSGRMTSPCPLCLCRVDTDSLLCGWLGVNGPAVHLHPTAPPIHFTQTEGNGFPFVFSFWSGWSLAGVNWYKSVNLWTSIEVDGGSNRVCLKRGEPDRTSGVKGAHLFSQAAKEELELEVQLSFTSEKI